MNSKTKYALITLIVILICVLFVLVINTSRILSASNQNIFGYSVKVKDAIEKIDKIFERSEVNVNVLVDSIFNSYDIRKQQDKTYNLQYVKSIDNLVKSALSNSPGVDGCWFQLNAGLPFAVQAYNWYEFNNNQFVNVKDSFIGTPSMYRKITPESDPYYFDAIMNQSPVWSGLYTDADTGEKMLTISAPVYSEGKLVGVVGIDISENALLETLNNMQSVLGNSEIYLQDQNNKVIIPESIQSPDGSKNKIYSFENLFGDTEGPVEYYDHFTKKTAIRLELSNDYKVIIVFNNKDLYSTNSILNLVYVLFTLLIVLLMFIVFDKYGIKSNQPLESNEQATDVEDISIDDAQDENLEEPQDDLPN